MDRCVFRVGVEKLYRAVLYGIIGVVLILVFSVTAAATVLLGSDTGLAAVVVIGGVSLVVVLVFALVHMLNGFRILKRYSKKYSIGYLGARLYILSLVGLVLGILAIGLGSASSAEASFDGIVLGIVILAAAALVSLVASIMIGLALRRLSDELDEDLLKIGAGLYIVGSALSIAVHGGGVIVFIGIVLIALGLRRGVNKTICNTTERDGSLI